MTGAAQTSRTSTIVQRPRLVRRSAAAWRVDGSECTLKLTSSVESGLAGADESMPDIEGGDRRRDCEPLDRVAVVPVDVGHRPRPVAQQAVAGCAWSVALHDGQGQQV